MLPFPDDFDQNEWLVLSVLILSLLLLLLPKRFPISIAILVILFSASIARITDHLLASPAIDFYDIMDNEKYEFFGVLTYFMYSPFAYFFVYIYDKFKIKGIFTVLYIVVSALFGVGFEWLCSIIKIFHYKEWELPFSFTVYLVVQYGTIVFFQFLKRQI